MKRIAAATLALAAAGCSFLRDPSPIESLGENTVVHALLVTGADTVQVLVIRAGPGTDPTTGENVRVRPVIGADVRLGGVRLTESAPCYAGYDFNRGEPGEPPPTAGCYTTVIPGGVRPGTTYALRVGLPGGGTVEGQATARAALSIQDPRPGARLVIRPTFDNSQTIAVRVNGGEGAAAVSVDFLPLAAFRGGSAVPNPLCFVEYGRGMEQQPEVDANGVVRTPVHDVTCVDRTDPNGTEPRPYRPDSLRTRLRVTAFDSAYVRYITQTGENAVSVREARVGLTSGLGLFAAAARADRDVVLIPQR